MTQLGENRYWGRWGSQSKLVGYHPVGINKSQLELKHFAFCTPIAISCLLQHFNLMIFIGTNLWVNQPLTQNTKLARTDTNGYLM